MPPPALVVWLVEEVILSSGFASERFAVTDLLKVIQTAGDTLVAVAVEGVQVDGSPAVNVGIDFESFKNRLSVGIHNSGSRCAVGIDEIAVLVSLIIWSFEITVTERCLDGGEGRNGLAVTLQLALTFLISGLDSSLDLGYRCGMICSGFFRGRKKVDRCRGNLRSRALIRAVRI